LYYVNGWIAPDNTVKTAKVYYSTYSNESNQVFTISGYHISKIVPTEDSYLLLLEEGRDNKTGLTLLCIDSMWKEKWKYPISDGLVNFFASDDFVLLETYSLQEKEIPTTTIILDRSGNELIKRLSEKGEGILYADFVKEKQLLFTIIRTSYDPQKHCMIRAFDETCKKLYELELPFAPDEETVIDIISHKGDEYLITERSIYKVNEQDVTIKTSVNDDLNLLMKSDEYFISINHSMFGNGSYYYIGYIMNQAVPKGMVFVVYEADLTDCRLRVLELQSEVLCASITENEELVLITEEVIGKLNIVKWKL
jgi:hypothetical protein